MCQTEGTPLGDASNKGLGPKMQNHQLSWWIFIYLYAQCGLQIDYESHRKILCKSKAMTFEQRIIKLNQINIGWINYY